MQLAYCGGNASSIALKWFARACRSCCAITLFLLSAPAWADIFQWEYIDPTNPGLGKRQSTTLAPDGAGVSAVHGAYLENRNLTMAYLAGVDLTNAKLFEANLTSADLSHANLWAALFVNTTLTDADFSDADVRGAAFVLDPNTGRGG